jgi:hypothetical protein
MFVYHQQQYSMRLGERVKRESSLTQSGNQHIAPRHWSRIRDLLDFTSSSVETEFAILKISVISQEFCDRYLSNPDDPYAFEGTADRKFSAAQETVSAVQRLSRMIWLTEISNARHNRSPAVGEGKAVRAPCRRRLEISGRRGIASSQAVPRLFFNAGGEARFAFRLRRQRRRRDVSDQLSSLKSAK